MLHGYLNYAVFLDLVVVKSSSKIWPTFKWNWLLKVTISGNTVMQLCWVPVIEIILLHLVD